jgi:predicted nucleic acid-binding protein
VTKHLLDTNIVSEVFKPEPSAACLQWLGSQVDADLFVSAFTIAEIRLGVVTAPEGRKRRTLESWFHGEDGPPAVFRGRILPFDERAALIWAELVGAGQLTGRSRSRTDMIIAATALANGCMVATANETHFEGVAPMINPMRQGA